MKEIKIKPCANGKLCSVVLDEKSHEIVIFGESGQALGYFELKDIVEVLANKEAWKIGRCN